MAPYAQPNIGRLVLVFSRAGDHDERIVVGDGSRAVSAAMKILSLKDELRPGDKLTVERREPAVERQESGR